MDALPTKRDISNKPKYWIGIGASAGGLEALRALVRSLPKSIDATYIIAQHLSPHHRSMLPEIIGRETDFEVLNAEDNITPEINKIYITPHKKNIIIEGDKLRLISPSREVAVPKPSIDVFFKSLAQQKKSYAIGIILSGTGSDGAYGIRDIRSQGGITIAQDELTAKYSGMPIAAVHTGCVDLIMSPEEIGSKFAAIIENRTDLEYLKTPTVHPDGITELIHLLHERNQVNFRHYKLATLQRRIERRMAAIGVKSIDDYVSVARQSNNETDALFRDFLISVTSFFRDPAEFEVFRKHLAKALQEQPENKTFRVWVPGCATGEEVYTIAMLIAEITGGIQQFKKRRVQLFASDVDLNAIDIARRGFYPEISLEEVPANYLEKYFDRVPSGFSVKKTIREKIVFSPHNLIQDPPFINIDAISCRNLLIYFQNTLQAQVLTRFFYSLVNEGILFLGKSETVISNESLFKTSEESKHLFFKSGLKDEKFIGYATSSSINYGSQKKAELSNLDLRDINTANARFESLVKALGGSGFLIGEDLKIRQTIGDVNPYISVSDGAISLSVSSLISEPFAQEIRVAVPIVIKTREKKRSIAYGDPSDPTKRVRVTVYPIESGPVEEVLALAIISECENPVNLQQNHYELGSETADIQIGELRQELEIAQTNLQHTVEELETTNEELQALNEELQSSNEELQSTNEELETSNEELQSTNEELSTINEELQVSSYEVRTVNQSLNNVLANVNSSLIVVDLELNIIKASKNSERLFRIQPDISLPHLSLLKKPDGFPDLVDLATKTISSKKLIEKSINQDDINALVTAVPNLSENDEVEGAILQVFDNTEELKAVNQELQNTSETVRQINESLNNILININASLIVLDLDLTIVKYSKNAEKLFDIKPSDKPLHIKDLEIKEGFQDIYSMARAAIANSNKLEKHLNLDDLNALISVVPNLADDGKVIGAIVLITDNTLELKRTNEELQLIFDNIPLGVLVRSSDGSTIRSNTALEQILELPSAAIKANKLADNVSGDSAKKLQNFEDELHDREQPILDQEAEITLKNNQKKWINYNSLLLKEPQKEKPISYTLIQDITDKKLREDDLQRTLASLARSNEELNRFSYVCSHDMKEPVRMIEAMCELLRDPSMEEDEENRRELITRIDTNTKRLKNIITSLLAYSRIDGKVKFETVELNEVTQDILETLELKIEETSSRVEIDPLPEVYGARIHFHQLFLNLVSNAIKYSNKKSPRIRVAVKDIQDFFEFTVEDNGPGIPKKSQEEVFSLFKRLHRRDEVEGSGLGLSICQRIVEQYGGMISVESSKKLRGACFKFTIQKNREK